MPLLASTPKPADLQSKITGKTTRDARQKLTGSSLPNLPTANSSAASTASCRHSATETITVTSASGDAEGDGGLAGSQKGGEPTPATLISTPAPLAEPGAYPFAKTLPPPSSDASQSSTPLPKRKRPRSEKQKKKARENAYARRKLKRQQEAQERDRLAALSTSATPNLIIDVITTGVETPKATPSTFAARDVRLTDTASPTQVSGTTPAAPTKRAPVRSAIGRQQALPRPPANPRPQVISTRGRGRGGLRSGPRPGQIEGERAAREYEAANPGHAAAVRAAWAAKRSQQANPPANTARQARPPPRAPAAVTRPTPPLPRLPHGAIRANYTRGPRASPAPRNSAFRPPAPTPDIAGMPPLVPIEAPPTASSPPQPPSSSSAAPFPAISSADMVSLLGNWLDDQRRRRETEDTNMEKISELAKKLERQ